MDKKKHMQIIIWGIQTYLEGIFKTLLSVWRKYYVLFMLLYKNISTSVKWNGNSDGLKPVLWLSYAPPLGVIEACESDMIIYCSCEDETAVIVSVFSGKNLIFL